MRAPVVEPVADVAVRPPAPALRAHVGRYVGYRLEGFAPGTHAGLPSRHLTFIISLGDPVDVAAMPDRQQPPGCLQAFVGGLHSSAATIVHDGNQHGVSVDLSPFGARALLGLPASAIATTVVELSDLLAGTAAELVDRLHAAPTWESRFAVLDEILLRRAHHALGPPPDEIVEAWRRLTTAHGGIDVSRLASEIGWSRRHFGQRFRDEIGLTPKVAARVLRFERSRQMLERADRSGRIGGTGEADGDRRVRRFGLADVAAMSGYYDQAHLTREWRELAGTTPARWMAEELPSVQAATHDGDAS